MNIGDKVVVQIDGEPHMVRIVGLPRTCQKCGKVFADRPKNATFCSGLCARAAAQRAFRKRERQAAGQEHPLRTARHEADLTLNEVARRAHIDKSQLSRIERGKGQPSIETLTRLARVLGLDELANGIAPYALTEHKDRTPA